MQIQGGWLIIDKPLGVTCTHVGSKIKRALGIGSVGHLGTLDPLATGVIVFALAQATKYIPYLSQDRKEYVFDIVWGQERTTGDLQGEISQVSEKLVCRDELENIIPRFIGNILQKPPLFSAIHVKGKRAYELARQGIHFELEKRQIYIHSLKILNHDKTRTRLHVSCGKGTYIRALAQDIAYAVQSLGYVGYLRRVQDGPFSVPFDPVEINLDFFTQKTLTKLIKPIGAVLDDIPAVSVLADARRNLLYGRSILNTFNLLGTVTLWSDGVFLGTGCATPFIIKPKRLINFK